MALWAKDVDDVSLVTLNETHAQCTYQWMSTAFVRDNVGVRKPISLESTRDWIVASKQDSSISAFAILVKTQHVGNLVFDKIDVQAKSARLSIYIGVPEARGAGIGRRAIEEGLSHMFQKRGMNQIWLTVHSLNTSAIRLYETLGFELFDRKPGAFSLGDRQVDELHYALARDRFFQ